MSSFTGGRELHLGNPVTFVTIQGAADGEGLSGEPLVYVVANGILPNWRRGGRGDQCIGSLASRDGILYDGTSTWGGLGIEPRAAEAVPFVWDVDGAKLVAQGAPLPGEGAAMAALGPDGR